MDNYIKMVDCQSLLDLGNDQDAKSLKVAFLSGSSLFTTKKAHFLSRLDINYSFSIFQNYHMLYSEILQQLKTQQKILNYLSHQNILILRSSRWKSPAVRVMMILLRIVMRVARKILTLATKHLCLPGKPKHLQNQLDLGKNDTKIWFFTGYAVFLQEVLLTECVCNQYNELHV